jgi:hypothetical protein
LDGASKQRNDIRSLLRAADGAPRAMIERALPDAEQATALRNLLFHGLVFFDPSAAAVYSSGR